MEQIKSPKVLIIGTGSLLNYGCEAIVHGTYTIIKKIFPDSSITVASDDIAYDRSVLPNDVNLINYRNRFTPYRIFKGILRRVFHIGNGSVVRMNTSIGNHFDIILSCGGDNYCERPDHGIYNLLRDLMQIGENASEEGKKYVLWGASVGPFHNKAIERLVVSNLSRTVGIFVREELSYKYLSQFQELKGQLKLVADPAFQMQPLPCDFQQKKEKVYIGVNMSELAVGHTLKNAEKENRSKSQFAEILDDILDNDNRIELVFIPHVNMDGPQNDMNYLRPVYDAMKHPERVHLINPGLGAQKTKGLIQKLDLLIAARMHCCVGGISVGTPTLFITYSNKGKGMSKYAYGHHNYEIACDQIFTDAAQLKNLVLQMLDNRNVIRKELSSQKSRFDNDSMKAGYELFQSIE